MSAWRDPGDERSFSWSSLLTKLCGRGEQPGDVENRVYYRAPGGLLFYVDAASREEALEVAAVISETAQRHNRKVDIAWSRI